MFFSCKNEKTKIEINLSDENWTFHQKDSNKLLKAIIPGSVQMDLLRNGEIPDPYYRNNENDLQWIGERDWIYETQFNSPPELLEMDNIEIVFEGLDTYAHAYLNDSLILDADNFFRSWKSDIKGLLHSKENNLRVEFTAPSKIDQEKLKKSKVPLLHSNVYTRKPAYHYGWDWGPIYMTQGIWKPVILKAWNNARIENIRIIQNELTDEKAELTFVFEIEADKNLEINLKTSCSQTRQTSNIKTEIKRGINTIKSSFTIENPKKWWSNGLGEAHLYDFSTELKLGTTIIDKKQERFGLRTIELVQQPDSLGKSFHFELNGIPVFMKGANYIPQDMFLNRPTDSLYKATIQNAVNANMNMLRVWGGGFYENDIFYDLCDENGILVWQDFMYACAMYPGEEAFRENIKAESIEQVKRLRNHPSIALWCGNNENYIGWQDWGWSRNFSYDDSVSVWRDYENVFHEILPNVIAQYDSDRYYWPSSPLFGWGYPVNTEGDVHYWGIWHGQEPFEAFLKKENIGRFMSEFGFQSCPEMSSVKKFTLPKDHSIDSDVMKTHQKHRIGYPVIDKYMEWYYQPPKNFESYLYVSQLLQSFGMEMGIAQHRRAMPHCMGTLYWQLNDCYPVASWSSVDVYGKWKAMHYKVRELYENTLVSAVIENDRLNICGVFDKLEDIDAQLELTLYDFNGEVLKSKVRKIKLKANSSEIYFSEEISSFLEDFDPKSIVLSTEIYQNERKLASNNFYFVYPKELKLKSPVIELTTSKTNEGYSITLTSKKLAKNVFLSTKDGKGFFTDNFFDLIPGIPIKTHLNIDDSVDVKKEIQVQSLFDTYNLYQDLAKK